MTGVRSHICRLLGLISATMRLLVPQAAGNTGHRTLALAVAGLLLASAAAAQPMARVELTGDRALEQCLVEAVGGSSAGSSAVPASRRLRTATERAQRLLRSEGYYSARIAPRIGLDDVPVIAVHTGPRTVIQGLSFDPPLPVEMTIPAPVLADVADGLPLRAQSVIEAETGLLAWARTHGWPDASAGERRVVVDHASGTASITYRVSFGGFARFGQIEDSSGVLDERLLERLRTFEPGAPVDVSALRRFTTRLSALDAVAEARTGLGEPDPVTGSRPVEVGLVPAPRNAVEFGLRYATSEGAGLHGAWQRRNVSGFGDTVEIAADIAALEQGVELSYSLPHWRRPGQQLTTTLGIGASETDAFDQDEIAVAARVSRAWRDQIDLSLGGVLDISRVTAGGVRNDSATASAEMVLQQDTRDSPVNPRSGGRSALRLAPAVSFGDQMSQRIHMSVRVARILPVSDDAAVALRVQLAGIVGGALAEIPADQRLFAGGGGSVRGFDYQSIGPRNPDGSPAGGRSLLEIGAEYRHQMTERWGGVVFADAGQAGDSVWPGIDDAGVAVGIGARYYLDFAPIRIDLAYPVSGGSDRRRPYIYFGFGHAF